MAVHFIFFPLFEIVYYYKNAANPKALLTKTQMSMLVQVVE